MAAHRKSINTKNTSPTNSSVEGKGREEEKSWNMPMKYSWLLHRGRSDIHRGLTFFFLWHEFCTISTASTLWRINRANLNTKVKSCLYQRWPVVGSDRVWFVTAGREKRVLPRSPGKFSSDDGGGDEERAGRVSVLRWARKFRNWSMIVKSL